MVTFLEDTLMFIDSFVPNAPNNVNPHPGYIFHLQEMHFWPICGITSESAVCQLKDRYPSGKVGDLIKCSVHHLEELHPASWKCPTERLALCPPQNSHEPINRFAAKAWPPSSDFSGFLFHIVYFTLGKVQWHLCRQRGGLCLHRKIKEMIYDPVMLLSPPCISIIHIAAPTDKMLVCAGSMR